MPQLRRGFPPPGVAPSPAASASPLSTGRSMPAPAASTPDTEPASAPALPSRASLSPFANDAADESTAAGEEIHEGGGKEEETPPTAGESRPPFVTRPETCRPEEANFQPNVSPPRRESGVVDVPATANAAGEGAALLSLSSTPKALEPP